MTFAAILKLVRFLPDSGRLLYCLYRDPRTSRRWKLLFGAAVFAIVTPFINVPEVIPVLGEMETVALLLLASKIALARAPRDLVAEHEAAIEAGTSLFHHDLHRALETAGQYTGRVVG
jgi:uncharacterized membrane protein YkvA (DUF1232 family)